MLVLITYDVSTSDSMGAKRLRRVAKLCQNYGQRVQNSVFECEINSAQLVVLKKKMNDIINLEVDSIRYYNLGNNFKNRIEHVGSKHVDYVSDTMII